MQSGIGLFLLLISRIYDSFLFSLIFTLIIEG
jgi:hypothetical protein